VFNLGFYRVALAATARWGRGSVVVAPLDERRLRLALRHGRFVFLACHGRGGVVETRSLWVAPPPAAPGGTARCLCLARREGEGCGPWVALAAGQDLQVVYNTACDGGSSAGAWQAALAPAEVKTFDRLSAVAEHVAWLWFVGPARVREIKEPAHGLRGGRGATPQDRSGW
jgi:hypothetical protein